MAATPQVYTVAWRTNGTGMKTGKSQSRDELGFGPLDDDRTAMPTTTPDINPTTTISTCAGRKPNAPHEVNASGSDWTPFKFPPLQVPRHRDADGYPHACPERYLQHSRTLPPHWQRATL